MINELRLIKPSVNFEKEYLEMLQEWKKNNEKLVPWVLSFNPTNFPLMIAKLKDYSKGIGLKLDQVEHSTYWLVNKENRILGVVNIRHRLNDNLLRTGGHIGYGIRPNDRKKGYATELLRQSLEIVKNMGIDKALLTCDKTNVASSRTIIKNGGILENEEVVNGNIEQKYWIKLS